MGQIIRVYNTKENATRGRQTSGGSGLIDSSTVDSNAGAITNAPDSNDDNPYFIYNRYYYRIDANEPVSEFHIDWDDGEDNSPEKRNIQIIKCNPPSFYTVAEHIYTEACTEDKKFFPLVRVKSMDGFLSKWYTNDASQNIAHNSTKALETFVDELDKGENLTSQLSLEKAGKDLIPHFCPANVPPICILKVDKKRVYSGINNRAISNVAASGATAWPLLYAYVSTSVAEADWPSVKLTVQGKKDRAIREYTLAYQNLVDADGDINTAAEIATHCVPKVANDLSIAGLPTESVDVLLRAELLNATSLADNDRIYVKVFNAVKDLSGNADVSDDATVCVLSNGNPIVDFNEVKTAFTVDTSESYTKASNLDIKNAYIDDDNLHNATIQSQASISSKQGNISDEFHADLKNISTSDNYSNTQLSYSYHNKGHLKDSNNRFYPFNRLIRAQVADNYSLPNGVGDIANRRSFIEHYDDDQYVSTVNSGPLRVPDNLQSRGLLLYSNNDTAEAATWRDLTTLSRTDGTMIGASGTYTLRYAADTTTSNMTYNNHPKNHLLLCKTSLFDRVYFRLENTYADTDSATDIDITAHYAHEDGWKPLEIQDGTLGLKTSGGIKFKIPEDWKRGNYSMVNSGNWVGPVPAHSTSEVTTFDFGTGNDRGRIAAQYVTIYTPQDELKYVFWFYTSGSDSAPTGLSEDVLIAVDISGGANTDVAFATALASKIDAMPEFSASVVETDKCQVTHVKGGPVTNGTSSDAQITAAVTTQGAAAASDPATLWDFYAYAIMISINAKAATCSKIEIKNIWPFNNSHSQLIKIEDPHHVSLNDMAVVQDISYTRSGKFVTMTDRFGMSEIRKLGNNGGEMTIGGVDLNATDRNTMVSYQKDATPLFYDITHKNSNKTRFYGVVTSMQEQHPVGGGVRRYNISMGVTHLIELDSSGNITSDKISIGGNINDRRKYISSS